MTSPVDHESRDAGIGASIGALIRDGAQYLAELIQRIVSRITDIVPLIAAIGAAGCEPKTIDLPIPPPPVPFEVSEPAAARVETPVIEQPIGRFSITFYYVVSEDEVLAKHKPAKPIAKAPANDNQPVAEPAAAPTPTQPGDLIATQDPLSIPRGDPGAGRGHATGPAHAVRQQRRLPTDRRGLP